jgi:hypothetical protein
MASELLDHKQADVVSALLKGLVTRSLSQVADEARLDGESLRQVVDRYEIDYAWHVLGSERMREACASALAARLKRPATVAEQADMAALLAAAAAAQSSDALMSFDNDVAQQLGGLLAK